MVLQPVRAVSAAVKLPEDRQAAAAAVQTILGIKVKFTDVGSDPSAPVATSSATVVDIPVGRGGDVTGDAATRAIRNALTRTRLVGTQALAGMCAAFQRASGVAGADQAFLTFWQDRCATRD